MVPGSRCVFDWQQMEQRVAEVLLPKACLIDFEVRPFLFEGEAFAHDVGLLELRGQEASPEGPRSFLMATVKASELLASLQAAIAVAKRLAPAPEMALEDLCGRWLRASRLQEHLRAVECEGLQLRHIVHLFEAVELQAAQALWQDETALVPYRHLVEGLKGLKEGPEAWF